MIYLLLLTIVKYEMSSKLIYFGIVLFLNIFTQKKHKLQKNKIIKD